MTVDRALLPLDILAWEFLGRAEDPFGNRQDALFEAVSEVGCDRSVVDSTVTCVERSGGTWQHPKQCSVCKLVSMADVCFKESIGNPTRRWASPSRRCSSDRADRQVLISNAGQVLDNVPRYQRGLRSNLSAHMLTRLQPNAACVQASI